MSLPVSAGAPNACAVVTPGFLRRRRSSCQRSQLPAATAAKIASGPRESARLSCRCSAGCCRLAGRRRDLDAAPDTAARSPAACSCGTPASAAAGLPMSTAADALVVAAADCSASDSGSIESVTALDSGSLAGSSGRFCGCTTLDGMGGMVGVGLMQRCRRCQKKLSGK